MVATVRSPENTNPLQPTKYTLTFSKIIDTQYFCQSVNIPGLELPEVNRSTPFNDQYSPGTKITYSLFSMSFLVDEELRAWRNIHDWMRSIAAPEGFDPRTAVRPVSKKEFFADMTLTILSALNNPILRIKYYNVFPVSLSGIDLDTKSSADDVLHSNASFRYEYYDFEKI